MAHPEFKAEELEVKGFHDSISDKPGPPILNSPITTKENTMKTFNHEDPQWFISCGMAGGDYKPFRPAHFFPDLWAAHDFMCSEPAVDWDQVPEVQEGWFGVKQQFVPSAGGCMPVPGTQLIDDMNDWEQLPWPNLDDIDWELCAEQNKPYLENTELPIEFCIPTLYWERLMSILEVTDAAIALVDEDQADAIHAFFAKLTDLYCDMLERVKKYFNPELILAHDDWGHQNGPFFSHETCEEFIAPYFKRFVAKVHELGMRFELHCCGKAESFVDIMIDCGVDLWIPQPMNDVEKLIKDHKDDPIVFGVYLPILPPPTPVEEVNKVAEEFVAKYKGNGAVGYVDYINNVNLYKRIYELSREDLA